MMDQALPVRLMPGPAAAIELLLLKRYMTVIPLQLISNLGYGIVLINQRLRLYGINTPEVRGPEKPQGLVTRDAVRDLILHKVVILDPHSFKKGKYGRWLATVWYKPDPNGLTWINLNQYIVQAGLGAAASY